MSSRLAIVLALSFLAGNALGETAHARLTLVGQATGSVSLSITAVGGTASNLNTAAASTNIGSVSRFSSPPPGFTLTEDGTNWILTTTLRINVTKTNLNSASYVLKGGVVYPLADTITYHLNGVRLFPSVMITTNSAAAYGVLDCTWKIVIPYTAQSYQGTRDYGATGVLDNVMNLSVLSN